MRSCVAILIACAAAGAASARADCAGCHSVRVEDRLRDPVDRVASDVHGGHDLSCADCHGGDAGETTMRAHDPAQGFRGRTSGLGTVMLCGQCHGELAHRLRGGPHARLGAPSCTTCHGAHGVRTPRGEVEACGQCHSDRERVGDRLPIDQEAQWRQSVHGLLHRHMGTPDCSGCHGAHDARTGMAAVAACGRCHVEVRAGFDRGPHGARFAGLGVDDSVECHGEHAVRAPDASMLAGVRAVCARCHREEQEAFTRIRALAAQSERIEQARALPWADPRRRAVVEALHALDAPGLETALAQVPRAPAPPARPRPQPRVPLWVELGKAGGAVVLALGLLWLVRRSRRLP